MSFGEPWFYIVILGAASILYAFILPARNSFSGNMSEASNIEATLEQYMADIEKENAELIELVAGMKQELTSKQMSQQESIAELRQRLLEVEQWNRQLESRLGGLESSAASPSPASSELSSQMAAAHQHDNEPAPASSEFAKSLGTIEKPAEVPEAQPAQPEAADSLRSRYPELFDLYARGKSIDMIAKTIGIQRGEVQLILQLANREDA